MNLSILLRNINKTVKSNSSEILTALGVSGVITTAYLTGKASFRACAIIERREAMGRISNEEKKKYKYLIWKEYVPSGVSGVVTVVCIIGASKTNARRTTAAVTAYSLTEKAFSDYREKVVEQIGKGKEQKIRDDIAQENVNKIPPSSKDIVIVGSGQVLCCELYTHRYFRSDMEALRRAQNTLNSRIISDSYVPLFEFYELVGLPYTSASNELGWDSDKLMDLRFSTVLSEAGEPCLAFDYNYVKPLR